MGDRYHNNHTYDQDPYYDHSAEPNRFHSSGDLSGSGSGSGGSYIDPRDRDLEAGDGYSGPDDLVCFDPWSSCSALAPNLASFS